MVQLLAFALITMSLDFKPESIAKWFESFAQSPLAIPGTFVVYVLGAFVNVPQWTMHGGVGLAFGPFLGSVLAWAATLVSASFDFWLGMRLGAERIRKISKGRLTGKFMSYIKQHGFFASLVVRIVPTGPFLLVNMAAGVAGVKFKHFFYGTALGSIPKIIGFVLFGDGIKSAVTGKEPLYIAIVVGIALIWMAVIYFTGSYLKAKEPLNNRF